MILNNQDIKRLQAAGKKVAAEGGKPYFPRADNSEQELLRQILQQLWLLNQKPVPVIPEPQITVTPEAANVTVQPPEVNVTVPLEERPREWRFHLERDMNGQLIDIIARAYG